jgi:hypothetical protein
MEEIMEFLRAIELQLANLAVYVCILQVANLHISPGIGQQHTARRDQNRWEVSPRLNQSRETQKYGHGSLRTETKNDCAGEGQR